MTCQDGNLHQYIEAFDISTLLSPTNFGLDVELTPKFVIGGDVIGGFGDQAGEGQVLAVSNGVVAVINEVESQTNSAGEIDVYDTRGVTGSHTDIAPVLVIPNLPAAGAFPGTVFQTVAIGPTGSGTGGAQVLLERNTHMGHIRRIPRFRRR